MGEEVDDTAVANAEFQRAPAASRFWWTPSQRRVLIGGIAILLLWLTVKRIENPLYVSDPQPEVPSRFAELADRIDPNDADVAALSALPVIGPKKAADIIKFRETFLASHDGKIAFQRPEDLLRIKGIGGAMLATIKPYLIFPNEHRPAAATQPIISNQP